MRDRLAVHDDARRDVHRFAPFVHLTVLVVAHVGIVPRAPATEQHAALADFLVARQGFVPEVEQVVVQGDHLLHELGVFRQADQVVGEELLRWHGANTAGIERGRMDVASLHQAKHLASHPAHDQRFAVELSGEGVERGHDVGDRAELVQVRVSRRRFLRLVPDFRIGFADHLLAIVHSDQIVLEDAVVEHVLGGFAEVDDPLGHCGRADSEGHILRIAGARRVVVAADAADATGDEVGVAGILPFHEHAIAAEYGRRAIALRDLLVGEVDLGVDAEAADNPGDGVPGHFNQFARFGAFLRGGRLRWPYRSPYRPAKWARDPLP